MSFKIEQSDRDGKPYFQFCGSIDEEAKFLEVSDMAASVVIDLKEVTAINSVGIRAWIMWFSSHTDTNFIFVNCPKALVMQMNMVEGFLPHKSEVLSLEVPFFCEDCDEERNVLFHVGKEILVEAGQVKLNFDKDSVCKSECDPELDVSEVKFFRFLLSKQDDQAA